MKKILSTVTFLCFIFLNQSSFAKSIDNRPDTIGCNETILTTLDRAIDSISSFFTTVRDNMSSQTWVLFIDDMRRDSVRDAFDRCGSMQTSFENMYITAHNDFVYAINTLRESVYSLEGMSDTEKFQLVLDKINCYSEHIAISDPRFAPPVYLVEGGGNCWTTYRSEVSSARRARNSGWWNCTLGGLGITIISGGLGGGLGVMCHVQNQIDYRDALDDALTSLNTCLGN